MANREIRLLLIAPSAEVVGGQSAQAISLLAGFNEAAELRVKFFRSDRPLPNVLRWIKRIPYLRTITNGVLYWSALPFQVTRADVAHVFTPGHTAYALWTLPVVLLARVFGRPAIVHYHDGRADAHLSSSRLAARTLRMADRVIVPSSYLVDVFRRHDIPATAIANIVKSGSFRFRSRRRLRPVFLTNRGLEPLYNVDCVLRAFAIVQERYPEAVLTVAHDGPCRAALEGLAATLKLRNVVFTGAVSLSKMAELYDAADIYLMSPNVDNMPTTVLECFAAGLPVVSTNAGGIPHITEDGKTALLVDLDDHKALARCAIRLLEDDELAERISQAGHADLSRYDAAAIHAQWLGVYRELLGSRGDRARSKKAS